MLHWYYTYTMLMCYCWNKSSRCIFTNAILKLRLFCSRILIRIDRYIVIYFYLLPLPVDLFRLPSLFSSSLVKMLLPSFERPCFCKIHLYWYSEKLSTKLMRFYCNRSNKTLKVDARVCVFILCVYLCISMWYMWLLFVCLWASICLFKSLLLSMCVHA